MHSRNKKLLLAGCATVVVLGLVALVAMIAGVSWVVDEGQTLAGGDLAENGIEADAVIIHSEETGLNVDRYSGLKMLLQVSPEQGEPFRVEHEAAFLRTTIDAYRPGARLKVRYDPSDLTRVVVMSEPSSTAAPAGRLEQLEALRERGLVTDEEYRQKRREILDAL